MRAVRFDRYGPPEVLQVVAVPTPVPGRGAVRVAVHAAAVNPKDVLVRKGKFAVPMGRRWPKAVGYDLAGVVDAVGPGVRGLAVGDRVLGMVQAWAGGACAEAVVLPADQVAPLPEGLSWVEAAALPLVGLTALQALRDCARLQPGQRVAIHGASGGVGTVAVQIARAMGAHVTATGRAENHPRLQALGAHATVDYRAVDVLSQGPFDVVFDVFGDRRFAEARGALSPQGVYVSTVPGPRTVADHLRTRLSRGQRARLVVVRSRRRDLEALMAWVAGGVLRPVVDRVWPLADIAQAHAYLETKRAQGKVVLTVR